MRASTIVSFVALAATASAASLSSVAPLPSDFNGNPGCVAAYEASISDCSDFKSCSSSCKKALDSAANNIIVACRQASIPSSAAVFKAAMSGGSSLTDAVCGAADEDAEEEKEEPKPTSTKKISESTSVVPKVTDVSEVDDIIAADPIPTPKSGDKADKTDKEEETSSSTTKAGAAKTSAAGAEEDDSALGGDPFSSGSGDADKDSAAGGVKAMVGLVGAAVLGAMALVF